MTALVLPTEVVIVGHRWRVELVDDPDVSLHREVGPRTLGMTDLHREVIRIRGGGEQGLDCMRDTLLHEVLHAVFSTAAAEPDESELARVATILLDTLRGNPVLVTALLSDPR